MASKHHHLRGTWLQQCWYPPFSCHGFITHAFYLTHSAVYFHPARTIGGMVEADIFCFMGLLFSAFVCLSGMALFWWLDVKHGWEWLANLIVILWVGLSVFVVAWSKVWMAKPSFNAGMCCFFGNSFESSCS